MVVNRVLKCLLTALYIVTWCMTATEGSGGRKGTWELLLNNSGVVAMHMTLTHRNTVLMFDQTESGRSAYRLQHGRNGTRCTMASRYSMDSSCWAHSVEYRIATNKIRPLTLKTDPWCSSGSFLSNGTLIQTGGYGDGYRRIRYFDPCSDDRCDWMQSKALLSDNRWYATNQILPDLDRVIVVGGRRVFTYELVPKSSPREAALNLPLLHQTNDGTEEGDNLYPFVHLSSDGHLFIFANRDSILLNYKTGKVVKTFPRMPGTGSRSYPSTGSSVMLPLDHMDGFQKVEIMVCGGATSGAYNAAREGNYLKGLSTCGRIVITGERPNWAMEEMPAPRLLNDMLILPTGHILIINGASHGSAGWNNAQNPSLKPYLYKPMKRLGKRFSVLRSNNIARMYHSSAIVLPDGRVLVAGSNPNTRYRFTNVPFPTELRVQAFVPYYMGRFFDNKRAYNLSIVHRTGSTVVKYGEEFSVRFTIERKPSKAVDFNVYAPPFATHSLSMNQRMLKLRCRSFVREKDGVVHATLVAPPSSNVAPSGYYFLTVVNGGIPCKAQWVRFMHP